MGKPAEKSLSRRHFLASLGTGIAGMALAACAPAAAEPVRKGGNNVELVYQDGQSTWFPALVHEMLGQFEATHPAVRVFYSPDPSNLHEKMVRDMEAGTAPDVLDGCCEFLPAWAQKGYLMDLRPFVEADLDKASVADWDTTHYESLFTRSGAQFALPRSYGALALYYNRDLFDLYKVDYPDRGWRHNDYVEAMRQLTRDRDGDGAMDLWGSMIDIGWGRVQVHINGWGGHIVDPNDPKRSLLVEPNALEALRWIHNCMWKDHCLANPLDVRNLGATQAFAQGRLAMVEDGSWSLKDILESAKFRVGVAPLPAGPARQVNLATMDGYAISARTSHPEAAWELVKFLTSRDYGRAMARAHLLQPARTSLTDEWISMVGEQYPEKTKGLDVSVFAEGQRQGNSVSAEVFERMETPVTVLNAAFQQIFNLGSAPVESLYETTAQIEEAQRPS